jgi:aspartate carbamoyltransferase regulatory subunit
MQLSPKDYGLHARTRLIQLGDNIIGIVVERKSRIIMADGEKLLEKVKQIQTVEPSAKVNIVTTAPVCSKTRAFLEKSGITILDK